MRNWLQDAAEHSPEHVALVFGDQRLSYHALHTQAAQAAAWLMSLGVGRGTRVGMYAAPSVEAVAVIHALMRLGAVLVPLNLRLSHDELAYQTGYVDLVVYGGGLTPDIPVRCVEIDYANFDGDTQPAADIDLEATCALIFTSGTTGRPKPAELTFGNFYANALANKAVFGATPDDRWLCCLPLYHVGGLAILIRCVIDQMAVILHDGFSVERVNHALDSDGVTLVSLVPTMLYRVLAARTTAPPHLRLCLVGGAAASVDLVQRAQAVGIAIATTYGLTETASQVATQTVAQTQRKPGSAGHSIPPYTDIWIAAEDGTRCPAGVIGEVVVAGQTVMRGYYAHPEATAAVLRDGALYTGDLGYLDADGDLWLVQRRSDLIVSGGENVYPAEVEAALRTHPAVRDACVVGLPHPEWGQQVAALVVTDSSVTAAELTAFLRERLAGYKLPRVIAFADSLPMTGSGKVERRTVAAILAAGPG